jgi:Tfp pilus assembly protein PilN
MAENVLPEPTLKTAADYEAAIDQCLTEIQRLREKMDKDQADIDRLKAETRAILARLKAA